MSPARVCVLALALAVCVELSSAAMSAQEKERIMKVLESLQHCVLRSAFSFLEPESYPPSTLEQWRGQCKAQSEAFRCVKDNSKAAPALIKRGMSSLVSYRQRHQRKYCTNLNSEATKKFVAATKCIVDKRLDTYRKLDSDYMSKLRAIKLANFNDAAPELQHMCCATLKWRKDSIEATGKECSAHQAQIEELYNSIVSSEISLVCDDEDKLLAQVCPKLAVLPAPKATGADSKPNPTLPLYLMATLGEAE